VWYGDILPVVSLTEIKSLLHVNHPHDLFDSCILHHHYLRFHSMLEYVMHDEVFRWRSSTAAAHLFSIICDWIDFWSGAFCHFHFIVIIIIIYCYWRCIIVVVDGSIRLDISFFDVVFVAHRLLLSYFDLLRLLAVTDVCIWFGRHCRSYCTWQIFWDVAMILYGIIRMCTCMCVLRITVVQSKFEFGHESLAISLYVCVCVVVCTC